MIGVGQVLAVGTTPGLVAAGNSLALADGMAAAPVALSADRIVSKLEGCTRVRSAVFAGCTQIRWEACAGSRRIRWAAGSRACSYRTASLVVGNGLRLTPASMVASWHLALAAVWRRLS